MTEITSILKIATAGFALFAFANTAMANDDHQPTTATESELPSSQISSPDNHVNATTKSGNEVVRECWDTNPSASHSDVADCAQAELNTLITMMNNEYAGQLSKAKKADVDGAKLTIAPYTRNEEFLVKSQADFETYKQSECSRRSGFAYGGAAEATARLACEIDLTQQRIYSLKHNG